MIRGVYSPVRFLEIFRDYIYFQDRAFDSEEREIVFTLTPQDISRYSPELHAWCAAPGRYEIRIGHSSRDIRAVLALQYADAKI